MGEPAAKIPRPGAATEGDSTEQLAWRILTSPRTFAVVVGLAAALLVVATLVPQQVARRELVEVFPFHLADPLGGLGLHDVLASWPFLLLALLAALNVLGMGLRFYLRRGAGEPRGPAGPLSERVEARLDLTPAVVSEHLAGALGRGRISLRHDRGHLIARTGLWAEGLGLVALGALALLGALVVHHAAALDARVELTAGGGPDGAFRAQIRAGDLWLDRQLPFHLACDAPDPLDPARAHACVFTGQAQAYGLTLAPGYPASVEGASIRLTSERRESPSARRPVTVLVRTSPEAGPARLNLAPDSTTRLPTTGHALTAFTGPDGPVIVATRPGARPEVLLPRLDAGAAEPVHGALWLDWVPQRRLTARITTRPERPVLLAGLGLTVVGALLLILFGHVVIVVAPAVGGSLVSVTCPNRPGRARAVLAALLRASSSAPPAPPAPGPAP